MTVITILFLIFRIILFVASMFGLRLFMESPDVQSYMAPEGGCWDDVLFWCAILGLFAFLFRAEISKFF